MFDPSKMTILLQAAGGSGDWRMWHYVVADGDDLETVMVDGYFSAFAPQITPCSLVTVTSPNYVAQLVLLTKDNAVTTKKLCAVDIGDEESDAPHVQGVPGQADASTSVVRAVRT